MMTTALFRTTVSLTAIVLVGLGLGIAAATTDSFEEFTSQAQKAYKEGKFTEAKALLDKATQLIMEKRKEEIRPFLPVAPTGFEVKEMETPALPGMLASPVGTVINRTYTRSADQAEILVTYNFDSPQLEQVFKLMSGSMAGPTAAASQTKPVKIKDLDAIARETDRFVDLKVKVGPSMVISFLSTTVGKVDLALLTKMAESVNYAELKKKLG